MTGFDKREEGFEREFVHDEELKFKATARLDLPDRLRRKLVDDATNLVIGEFYSLGIEIGAQLVEHVVVAGRLKARRHECLGVGLHVRARERKLPGRP